MKQIFLTASVLGACLVAVLAGHSAAAQETASTPPKLSNAHDRMNYALDNSVDREYKLHYVQSFQDQNELLTAVRNMVEPQTKIFLVPSVSTIVVHGPEDVQVQVAKLLAALDQPHLRYRLTYTLTELDGTRKIGTQHFSMVATDGHQTTMKQGSRLPVQVSSVQSTYLEVGVNFDAALVATQGGAILKSKVEQTSVAPDSTSPSNPNPLLRQTLLEGTTSLVLNKPLLLGSLDVPSSTHHFDVEILMEPVN